MSALRALVGARVSHVQGEEKTSHISQRTKGAAYAESQGWEVVGTFEDLDVSAIKLSPFERPDLKTWLTDRAFDWDALIFAKTDRVFRSADDCVQLARWCKDNRKVLVLVDDGIKLDYFNPEEAKDAFAGAMSKVFLILASVFAEIEGQRFVQRARDRVSYLRHTDRWGYGTPPFGFRIVDHPSGVGKALDHDVEAQKVLHEAADRLLAGWSLTAIVHNLNERGVMSPLDWTRSRSGRPTRGCRWTRDKLRHNLSSLSTQGIKVAEGRAVLDSTGEPVRVGPPSFDPDTWDRVQQELAQRSQAPRERRHTTNPLLGVARCAVCGKNMRQRSATSTSGAVHRYYVCGKTPKPCPRVSVLAADAEEVVESAFLRVHADRRVRARVWRAGSDHSAELDQTIRTIESLREDRALGLFTGEADQELYRQQMAALVAKRDALAVLPVVRAGWVDVETDRTYAEVWPDATVEERRKLLVDAGIRLVVSRPDRYETVIDLDRAIGDGPRGQELYDEIEARAAAERLLYGVP